MNKANISGTFGLENYFSLEEIFELKLNQENGFCYIRPENYITTKNYNLMIDEILKEYNLSIFDYSRNNDNFERKYFNDSVIITMAGSSRESAFNIYCKSEFDLNKIYRIYIKHSKNEIKSEVKGFFESFYIKGNGLDKSTKVLTAKDFENISDKFYPFLDNELLYEQFCTGNENILILLGSAGLGKTKLTNSLFKYLIENPSIIPYDKQDVIPELDENFFNAVYVKSTDILVMDEFWRTIQKDQPDFVILDDLDYMLTKRESEVLTNDDAKKNAFLNQLLSFTDGIEKNKTKFIITTNQHFEDVDTALLRKGRLFDILEFRELKNEEALEIWLDNNLDEKTFKELFKKDVSQADLGSEIAKRLNTRIENTVESYLKESNISKVQRKSKKMSL